MLVSIEAAIDGCVKADGRIVAAFLSEFSITSAIWRVFGHDRMTKNKDGGKPSHETMLTHSGRLTGDQFGFVNTPVFRGSTVLFETIDDLDNHDIPYRYGRTGNPTTRAVETLITELEERQGHGARAVRASRQSRRRCWRCWRLATSCWSPTAAMSRRAISAARR